MNPGVYTANQPLCLGGQIYMWNRYVQCSDIVHMDTAQFTKFGHQSRIEVLDRKGTKILITIPLKDRSFKPLNEVLIDQPARTFDKVLQTLKMAYSRAPYFSPLYVDLDWMLQQIVEQIEDEGKGYSLAEFNINVFELLSSLLGLTVGQHYTSLMGERPEHPSEWVASMGVAINCKTYLGGGTAQKAYLRDEDFRSRGMVFVAQDYKMPSYARGKNAPNDNAMISILDPLFWLGPEGTRQLIGAQ